MQFADIIKLEKSSAIALVKAWDADKNPCYAYVVMDAESYRNACRVYDTGATAQFEQFGEVVVTGPGHAPGLMIEHFIQRYAESLNSAS